MNMQPGGILPFLSAALFLLGWICLITQRNALKQVIGLKILLQGIALMIILAGKQQENIYLAQVMVISALVVEAVIVSLALAMIINVFRHIPSGDIDQLRKLRG